MMHKSILIHVTMMHMYDASNHDACMYIACIYDAANFVMDGRMDQRTDEQGDSRSRIYKATSVKLMVLP